MSANLYQVQAGPEGYLPPVAACMGVALPEKGKALVEGRVVPEAEAMRTINCRLMIHTARRFR